MAQQIINVGSAPNDGTGDVLRNSQIKANANFTELYNAVDLKLDKVSTVDVEKVYIKNADGTQGMKPTSELGGGGADFLYENIRWVSFTSTTLNTWKSPTPYYDKYDTATINDFGTGVTPTEGTSGYYLTAFHIPDGYEVESIKLVVNTRTIGAGNLQVYINRGETNSGNISNIIANAFNIVNEVVSIPTGSNRPLFLQHLTVAPQSPITLAHGFLKISVRETTNSSINYGLNFNVIYKKI